MRLLLDTDAFCKLGAAGLLHAAIEALGVSWSECTRLAALPFMLKRGRLARKLGAELAEKLIPLAEALGTMPEASSLWLDRTAQVAGIDVGEAQIFACAAESEALILSGDKRALNAVRSLAGFPEALAGRVVTIEAILFELCVVRGDAAIRTAINPIIEMDAMLQVCFSSGNPTPRLALKSYLDHDAKDLCSLLWFPGELRST